VIHYRSRDFAFSHSAGLVGALLICFFFRGDGILVGSGAALALLEAAMLALLLVRPPARHYRLHFSLLVRGVIPAALCFSLLLTALKLPQYLFFVSLFWVMCAYIFNTLIFRARFLYAFLGVYLVGSLAVAFTVGGYSGFLAIATVFVTIIAVFLLWYHYTHVLRYERELEEKRLEVERATFYDRVTGLPNRHLFLDRLEVAVNQGRRQGRAFAVLVVDLDGFTRHQEELPDGARALVRAIGERMREAVRVSDTVACIGLDSFALLTGEGATSEQASRFGEKVLHLFDRPFPLGFGERVVSATIGISLFPGDSQEAAELLRRAEETVHRAKALERGAYLLFDHAVDTALREKRRMEEDLALAVPRGELFLQYQPKCDGEGRLVSHESLVRWRHPARGVVPPLSFISVLEESNLILDAGRWILAEAARQNRAWNGAGHPDLGVAVNLSPRQLLDPNLLSDVQRVLRESGLAGGNLELEITESMIVKDIDRTQEVLEALHALGIRISVDDFGTGYSSLVRLLELPVDVIKIDKSFVDKVPMHDHAKAVVRLIIGMAKHMGRKTVAEGVETREQLAFLVDEGCSLFQGYYFSRPLDAAVFGTRLGGRLPVAGP